MAVHLKRKHAFKPDLNPKTDLQLPKKAKRTQMGPN